MDNRDHGRDDYLRELEIQRTLRILDEIESAGKEVTSETIKAVRPDITARQTAQCIGIHRNGRPQF